MSTDLIRKSLEMSLQSTSLDDLIKEQTEVVMLLLDTSGSMGHPLGGGRRCIDSLREVVQNVRRQGHVPMIAFGGPYDAQVRFVDLVPEPDGGTPLHLAIPFAKQYGATRLVVISDGLPDLPEQAKLEAKTFGGRIDVVFVGDPNELFGSGAALLAELAKLTGGEQLQGDLRDVKQLTGTVIGLLEGPRDERTPIQGAGFGIVTPAPEDDEPEPDDEDDDEDEEDDDEDE